MRLPFTGLMQLSLVLGLSGCFVISDTDRFTADDGCDLEVHLREFSPHTRDLFEIRVVQDGFGTTSDEAVSVLSARAVFHPLEDPTLNFRMPNAVPALTDTEKPRHSIDLFGDRDASLTYSFRDDHVWRLPNACERGPEVFEHDLDFEPIPDENDDDFAFLRTREADVVVRLCNATGDAPVEVRVTGNLPGPDGGVERVTGVGFYRLGADLVRMREVGDDIVIEGVIDTGFPHLIEVYFDEDDSGGFTPGEPAFAFDYRGTELRCTPPENVLCDSIPPSGAFEACIEQTAGERDRLVVTLGPISDNSVSAVQEPFSWFDREVN